LQSSALNTNVSMTTAKQDLALTDLLLIFRKRRLLLAGFAFGIAALAVGYGLIEGKKYTARGEIQIQPDTAADMKQTLSTAFGTSGTTLDVAIESDIRILTSDKLLTAVARALKPQDDPIFLGGRTEIKTASLGGRRIPLLHGDLEDPFVRQAVLKILRDNLSIARIPRTQMISISYVSASPQLASNIVNALESKFIENNFVAHYSNTQQVSNWLTGQIEDLRGVVQNSQDKMVDMQKRLGISALDPGHNIIVQEITNLEKNVSDATQQRVLVEARYRILKSLPSDQVLDTATPLGSDGAQSQLSALRAQRAADGAELARLQPVYGPNYPQVKQLNAHLQAVDREIAKQETNVIDQAQDALGIADAAERKAKTMLDSRVHELYGQRDDIVQYELMSEEYESNRHMYESILARLREAAVDAGLGSADISVVDLASLPVEPSSASPRKRGAIGLFLGIVAGFAVALLLERMDTRMHDSKHIQELLGLPSLAIIPQTLWKDKDISQQGKVGPEMLLDGRSPFAEAFRVLRTSILLSSVAKQSRVLAVTSCQPSEGKSTVSTNLASALAQGGKRTILVDTDMRRPSVYWRLHLGEKKGLSEYLTGNESLERVIQTHQTLPTLDLIPSGIAPPLPTDLLASDRMRDLVQTLRERYEYVVFDTPPALSVTDPLLVASLADGLVLVIRQGYCTQAMLARAAEVLRDAGIKVYGFVFNGVDASLPEYYGYLGYYSYEYRS
jgi:succinoglycan biosynthesis transport protein ExoP